MSHALALTLYENAGILVGLVAVGFLIWLVLRPLRLDITIKNERKEEEDDLRDE